MMQAVEATTPQPAESAPIACTYYSAQNPAWPPLPCNVDNLPIWNLSEGAALLDDLDFDYSAVSERAQRDGRFQAMDMETFGTAYSPIYAFDTNGLWLEITNVSNGQAYLNLHNATKGPTIPYDATAYWTSGNGQTLDHTIYWNGDNCPVPPVDEDGKTDLSGYINDYPVPWLNANNSSAFVPGNYLARLNAETKLGIKPSAKQQTGAMQTYIILVSALEYMANNIYDLENLEFDFLADVDHTPIPPGQITVGGQNVVSTGITNTDGTTWGLTSITAPTGVPVPLPITATLSNANGTFVPSIQLAHLAIVDTNSGVDFTMQTSNTVIVGQQMNLTAQLMIGNQVVTNIALANFQWTVPGMTFSNYVANDFSGKLYTDFTTANSNVVFYWLDGANNRTVQCTATMKGSPVTAQAAFNVLRPRAQITATGGTVALDQFFSFPYNNFRLHCGILNVDYAGMLYSASVTLPPGYTGQTNLEWVQKVSALGRVHATNGVWYRWDVNVTPQALDTSYPFNDTPNDPKPWDAPASQVLGSFNGVSYSEDFTMWLMFKPDGDNAQWVPLRKVNWHWDGAGSLVTNGLAVNWVLTNTNNPGNPLDTISFDHPQWDWNANNTNHFRWLPE